MEEVFYVVSSLDPDRSGPLGERQRYTTLDEAIERAKEVTRKNAFQHRPLDFYVLKVVAKVEVDTPPVKLTVF